MSVAGVPGAPSSRSPVDPGVGAAAGVRARSPRAPSWAITATAALPLISISAPNVALPAIAADLGARFDELQWVIAAYTLTLAALQLVAGPIADRVGRRRATVAGLALFSAGGLLAAAAPGVGLLIAARALQGVGGAFVLTGALGLVAVAVPSGDRLQVLALRSAIIATAFAVGPLAGGLLTDLVGWRAVFAFDAALGLPLLLLLRRGEEERGPGRAATLDPPGLLALALTLVAVVLVVIRGNAAGWTSPTIVAAVAVAAAGAVVVVARQRRGHQLLPAELLRNRLLGVSVLSLLVLYVTVFGGLVFVTLYLHAVCGLGPTAIGGLLVSFAVASLAAVLVVTRSRHRERLDLMVPVALAVGAAGLAWIGWAADGRSAGALVPGLVLVGVASGVVNPLLTASQLDAFAPADGGIAAGVNGASRQFGTALGTAVLGAILQATIHGWVTDAGALGPGRADRVAAGDLDAGLGGLAPGARETFAAAYRSGVAAGLETTMLLAAVLLAVAAAFAAFGLRGVDGAPHRPHGVG